MTLQLVTLSFDGRPFYVYATDSESGTANYDAGAVMDRLVDRYGGGFSYAVTPLKIHSGAPLGLIEESAAIVYETGDGNPLNLEAAARN